MEPLDNYYLTNSAYELALGHGLIDANVMKELTDACCHSNGTHGLDCYFYPSDTCKPSKEVWQAISSTVFLVNPYNVLDDCPVLALYERNYRMLQARFNIQLRHPSTYAPKTTCWISGHIKWMNLPEVRKALHIPDQFKKWSICGGINYDIQKTTMRPQITDLVEKYKLGQIIIIQW